MANRFPLIFNSGAGQIQELAASDNLDLTSSNLVNAGILFTSSGSQTAPSISIGNGTTYPPGLYSPGTDQLAVATNGTQNLLIDASGNLIVSGANALNTGAGRGNVTINGTAGSILNFTVNGADKGWIFHDNTNLTIQNTTANALLFNTNNGERLRITSTGTLNFKGAGTAGSTQAVSFDGSAPINSMVLNSSGQLGIGTSTPGSRLEIGGDASYDAKVTFNRVPVQASNDGVIGELFFQNNADSVALIAVKRQSAADDAYIQFATQQTTGGLSEKCRITSDGKLLVGTTTSATDNIAGTGYTNIVQILGAATGVGLKVGNTADFARINLVRSASVGTNIELGTLSFGAEVNSVERARVSCFSETTGGSGGRGGRLVFFTAPDADATPTERMRIKANGDVSIVTGNLIIGTAGKGIDFSADGQAAGMTSELLDDYEEGTWTPSVGGTATYTSQDGRYTKIGNTVHVTCRFTINLIGTGSASRLSGLPFASASLGYVQSLYVSYYANISDSVTWISGYVEDVASTALFTANQTASTTIQNNGVQVFKNSANILFSATYSAA